MIKHYGSYDTKYDDQFTFDFYWETRRDREGHTYLRNGVTPDPLPLSPRSPFFGL